MYILYVSVCMYFPIKAKLGKKYPNDPKCPSRTKETTSGGAAVPHKKARASTIHCLQSLQSLHREVRISANAAAKICQVTICVEKSCELRCSFLGVLASWRLGVSLRGFPLAATLVI